eukprot:8858665-Lingulodinium_polyedra.AAC.1
MAVPEVDSSTTTPTTFWRFLVGRRDSPTGATWERLLAGATVEKLRRVAVLRRGNGPEAVGTSV